jgi:hypothetical protein
MTRDEIVEFVMSNSKGKTGLAAVGPIIDQLVNFVAWQQGRIEALQSKIEVLEILGANK